MLRTRILVPTIFVALAASTGAYGEQPPSAPLTSSVESSTYTLSVSLPQALALRDVVIGASSVDLDSDTTVSGPRSVAAIAAGTGGLFADPHGRLTTVWSRGDVSLTGANVVNDVHAAGSVTLKAGATVGGTAIQGSPYTEHEVLQRSVTFPAVSALANVEATSVSTLAAGRYGKLSAKPYAEIRLSAGRYYFDTIDTAPNSTITIDDSSGPVEIYVAGNVSLGGDLTTQSGHGAAVLLGVFGASVEVSSAKFFGTLIAPSASVRFQGSGSMTFTGAVFGAYVTALPHVTFVHDASSIIGIILTAAPGTVSGTPSGSYTTTGRPLDATLVTPDGGDPYYTDLKFDPAYTGKARFCDPANNPIEVTEADLNAPPPAGSKCAAVKPSGDECPLDPKTTYGSCTSDLECGSGERCGTQCANKSCTTTVRVCGKPLASCYGLPQEDNCQDYWLCPRDGDVTGIVKSKIDDDLRTKPALSPSALIPESVQTPLPDYLTLDQAVATACDEVKPPTTKQADNSSKPTEQGAAWGLYLEPTSSFDIDTEKRSDGIGTVKVSGSGGLVAGVKVMNEKVEVINANIAAEGNDCGLGLAASIKVFGETIVVWTPTAANSFHFLPDPEKEGRIATNKDDVIMCGKSRAAYKNERGAVRTAAIMAKAAKKYYDAHGFTPEFCGSIEAQKLPVDGEPMDPTKNECADVTAIPMARRVKIVNAWKNEYDAHTAKLADANATWGTSKQKIQNSGVIPLFDVVGNEGHPYSVTLLPEQNIPIVGPIVLNLAVGGYGSWNVKGGIAYGIGWDGKYSELLTAAGDGSLPANGDIRMHVGPSVTPDVRVGVWAYAGVGVPGLSVGIEGKVQLLGVAVPSEITAALMRVRGPMKDASGTDWDGTPVPGVEASSYRWITGIHFGSKLTLDSLSGNISLAARVKLLFFKKTFRQKLLEWTGLAQEFTLVGDGTGKALNYANHTGSTSDNVGYTQVDAVSEAQANAAGPGFPACKSIIK